MLPQAAADHKLDKQSAKEVQSFVENQMKIQQVPAERRMPPHTRLSMCAHADAPLQNAQGFSEPDDPAHEGAGAGPPPDQPDHTTRAICECMHLFTPAQNLVPLHRDRSKRWWGR